MAAPPPWASRWSALVAQQYGNLTTVVVAAGPESVTAAVAEVAPEAFVRPAPDATTTSEAANEGAAAVEGATFLLFCHDDTALEPGAVQSMVTEAFRANAGIVGAKLVDWDRTDVLRGVGMGIDKFGFVVPVAEPGELDQSQHDGAREVFMVPSSAMLVRADLFTDLGGFSAELTGIGADLDLCWRARVAGAQVVVMPAAVARHAETSPFADGGVDARRLAVRDQARTVLTCYSLPHLLRVLPQAAVLSVVDLVLSIVTGRFRRGADIVSAWGWNLAHLPSAVSARARIRRSRRVPDSDIRALQISGSARLLGAVRNFRGDGSHRVPDALAAARDLPSSWQSDTVMAGLALFVVLGAMYVIGSRQLIADGIPAIRDLLPFGHPTDLAAEWWSGWRNTGISHAGPAPFGFPLLGVGHFALPRRRRPAPHRRAHRGDARRGVRGLALLVPLDHPGHARPRLPRGAAATYRARHPPPAGLISLTCNEVQHLFATLVARPASDLGHRLRWSLWRRRHQARARTCHYQRQANPTMKITIYGWSTSLLRKGGPPSSRARRKVNMQPETATAQLSGQVWRHVVVVAAMVSAIVGGVVVVAGRTVASEPGVNEVRLQAPSLDQSCRELIAIPKWGWVCTNRRP